MGISSTRTNQGLRFHEPDSSTCLLQAAAAARLHEGLPALEAVVALARRAGQVAGRDGTAVQRGHDAHLVGRDLADGQLGAESDARDMRVAAW